MSSSPKDASPDPLPTDSDQSSRRVAQWERKIDAITNDAGIADLAYRDSRLTREAFDSEVLDTGYKIVLRVLQREAVKGDAKSMDLFLKRCDQWFAGGPRNVGKTEEKSPPSAPFVQEERDVDPKV